MSADALALPLSENARSTRGNRREAESIGRGAVPNISWPKYLRDVVRVLAPKVLPVSWSVSVERFRWELRVLAQLTRRELRLQHRGTVFGLAWAVANPLATAAVHVGLFSGILGLGGPGYPLAVLSTLVPWAGFTGALCAAAHAPLTHATLLRGHPIPVRLPVAAAALATLPSLLAGLAVVAVASAICTVSAPAAPALALATTAGPVASALALAALVALQLALAASLGLLLALANLRVRDTQHALQYVLRLAFFLTPIVWTLDQLPARAAWLATLNPLAGLSHAFRQLLAAGQLPAPALLGPAVLVLAATAALALAAEARHGRRLTELL